MMNGNAGGGGVAPSGASAPSRERVEAARARLAKVLLELNRRVIGHELENRVILTAVVAKENIAVIGPPGTAKSYTFDTLAKLLSCSYRRYQLTRFTTDMEIIGPYDIPAFVKQGVLIRKLSQILQSDIAYLDEAFKAPSGVLNALLSALQERVIYDPFTGQVIPVATKVFVVTSNEVPQEEELKALYDRFPIRIWVDYLYKSKREDIYVAALEARWLLDSNVQPIAVWDDVEVLNSYAGFVLRGMFPGKGNRRFIDVYADKTLSLVSSLRSKGIVVSDRTIIEKLPKLIAARCALEGVTEEVMYNAILDLLPFLAADEGERRDIMKVVEDQLGEVAKLHDKLEKARTLRRSGRLDEAKATLEELLTTDVTKYKDKPFVAKRLEAILADARFLYEDVLKRLQELQGE